MLEVLTPGNETYTTLAEFKAFYGITSPSRDVYWTGLLETASELVSDYCGRPLCSESVRETLRFDQPQSVIILERWPVTVTPVLTSGTGDEVIPSTSYEVDVRAGIIKPLCDGMYSTFSGGLWKVTYSGGYLTIPLRVKEAVWRTAYDGDQTGKLRAGVKSKRIEGVVSETFFDPEKLTTGLSEQVKGLLFRYAER